MMYTFYIVSFRQISDTSSQVVREKRLPLRHERARRQGRRFRHRGLRAAQRGGRRDAVDGAGVAPVAVPAALRLQVRRLVFRLHHVGDRHAR